jgi:hypothetical protein
MKMDLPRKENIAVQPQRRKIILEWKRCKKRRYHLRECQTLRDKEEREGWSEVDTSLKTELKTELKGHEPVLEL